MAVSIKFYDEDLMELEEFDAGESRMNYGTVTAFKIKNEGTDKARDCIIGADALNSLEELKATMSDEEAQAEYNKQKKAASWKTFCLQKDGKYTETLKIGNIAAGKYFQGVQTINESFSNKQTSLFQDVWSYCLETWGNNTLKIYKNESKSQTAMRKSIEIGEKRDVEIMFKPTYEYKTEDYANNSCLVIFPVRIDNRGFGYIMSFQFRAKDGKCFFGIYKNGKGMVSNLSRTYGTRIIDTNGYLDYDPNKFMGARIYTDDEGDTCFQFMINGEYTTLYKTGDKNTKGKVMKDPANTHPDAGLMFFDVGMYYGDLGITLRNFQITTETEHQTVYVKSKIDSDAIDAENYVSAITVNYIEG